MDFLTVKQSRADKRRATKNAKRVARRSRARFRSGAHTEDVAAGHRAERCAELAAQEAREDAMNYR